jgi:hypothetical protein
MGTGGRRNRVNLAVMDGGATLVREQKRRQRRGRANGGRLRLLGTLLSVVGAGCLVIGAALPWAKFALLGVAVDVPGVLIGGAVTGIIGMVLLLGGRRWPLAAVVFGLIALGVGATAQKRAGEVVVRRILDVERRLAPVNARLAQVNLPPVEPFGPAVGTRRDHTGPGPLWTVWGGALAAVGGALTFAGDRMRRTCARCGTLWPEARLGDLAFCPACGFGGGAARPACANCGGDLLPGDRFCVRCGVEAEPGTPAGTNA